MEFIKKGLIFVDTNTLEREGKKTLHFVSVADPDTYQNESFILDDSSPRDFKKGEKIDVTLIVKNKFSSVKLKKSL